MSELMDNRINALWYCLPADTMDQIVTRMKDKLGGTPISNNMGHVVLRHLRDNKDEYSWMVPLVKRGRGSKHRYMRVSVNGDGKHAFDRPGDREKLANGLYGTVRHTARMNRHQHDSLLAAMNNTRSSKYKEYILSLAEDCDALSKKAARVAKIIQMENNGTG